MALFGSKDNAGNKANSDIPESFLSAVRVMQDDLEGKPEQHPVINRTEKKEANPFSPDFVEPKPLAVPSGPTRQENPGPFVPASGPSKTDQVSQQPVSASAPTVPKKEITITTAPPKTKSFSEKKRILGLLAGIISVVLVLVLAGVSYYFLVFSEQPVAGPVEDVDPSATIDGSPRVTETPAEPVLPFSPDKPNYFPIDVEVATPESIRSALEQNAMRISEANMVKPVEFFVTDQNNNPIAFSRFAFVDKIALSPDLLALIEESFALFIYNDVSGPRFGLALSFKDTSLANQRIMMEEEALPYEFQPFLYGNGPVVAQKSEFHSGVHGMQAVRYVNIDLANNVSFDYTIRGMEWLIGSSKDTLRAIADMRQ